MRSDAQSGGQSFTARAGMPSASGGSHGGVDQHQPGNPAQVPGGDQERRDAPQPLRDKHRSLKSELVQHGQKVGRVDLIRACAPRRQAEDSIPRCQLRGECFDKAVIC